jgi:GWxTD domain-containing protein
MAGRHVAGCRLAAAVLSLLSWLAVSCSSGAPPPRTAAAGGIGGVGGVGLTDGPTRWLMLPDEQRQARQLRSARETAEFTQAFWDRRDPDPTTPANELARAFYERVEAADRLYSEGGRRGSMTDRGRALILLGPPPVLRHSQKAVPTWDPKGIGSRPAIHTRYLALESWIYQPADLDPRIAALLQAEEPIPEVVLVFAVEPRQTYLLDGEKYLDLAVRAVVGGGR